MQITDHDRLNTLYSLLLAGKENCVGEIAKAPEQNEFVFEPKQDEPEQNAESAAQNTSDEPETPEKPKGPSALSRLWRTFEKMLSDDPDGDDENA